MRNLSVSVAYHVPVMILVGNMKVVVLQERCWLKLPSKDLCIYLLFKFIYYKLMIEIKKILVDNKNYQNWMVQDLIFSIFSSSGI